MAVFDVGQHVVNNAAKGDIRKLQRWMQQKQFKDCGCPGGYGVRGFVLVIHGNDVDQYYHADSVNYHYR